MVSSLSRMSFRLAEIPKIFKMRLFLNANWWQMSDWSMKSTHLEIDQASTCHWDHQGWYWRHQWYQELIPFKMLNIKHNWKASKHWVCLCWLKIGWYNIDPNWQRILLCIEPFDWKLSSLMIPITSTYLIKYKMGTCHVEFD